MLCYIFEFIYDLVRVHARGGFLSEFGRQGFETFMHTPKAEDADTPMFKKSVGGRPGLS